MRFATKEKKTYANIHQSENSNDNNNEKQDYIYKIIILSSRQ